MRKTAILVSGVLASYSLLTGCSKSTPSHGTSSAGSASAPALPGAAAPEADASPPPPGAPATASASKPASSWTPDQGEPAPGHFPPATPRNFGTDGSPNLESLTLAMRDWTYYTGRFPKDMNDLVSTKYLSLIPAPPAGKKYVINPQAPNGPAVELANSK